MLPQKDIWIHSFRDWPSTFVQAAEFWILSIAFQENSQDSPGGYLIEIAVPSRLNFYCHIIDAFVPYTAKATGLRTTIKSKLPLPTPSPQEILLMIPCKTHPLLHTSVVLLFSQRSPLGDSLPPYCDSIWIAESVCLHTEAIHTSETFPPSRNLVRVFREERE